MWMCEDFRDFSLLDSGDGMKLERWGNYLLARPEPQAVWPKQNPGRWREAHGVYHRSDKGGGSWEFTKPLPDGWNIRYRNLTFLVRPTGFKHTGLFPEQAVNWDYMASCIQARKEAAPREELRVLNLFAYTAIFYWQFSYTKMY